MPCQQIMVQEIIEKTQQFGWIHDESAQHLITSPPTWPTSGTTVGPTGEEVARQACLNPTRHFLQICRREWSTMRVRSGSFHFAALIHLQGSFAAHGKCRKDTNPAREKYVPKTLPRALLSHQFVVVFRCDALSPV